MRIDGIIHDRPADSRCVERQGGLPDHGALSGRPGHEDAPVEDEPEHQLRPVGDALHQRVQQHQGQRGDAQQDGGPVELQQQQGARRELRREEHQRVQNGDAPAGDGPAPRPLHLPAEPASFSSGKPRLLG